MKKWLFILSCANLLWGQCIPVDTLEMRQQADDFLEWSWNHGFPFAEVELKEDQECAQGSPLEKRQGDAWVWARVKRLGEGKTKDEVIEGLSLLKPGEAVALKDLERARKRILRSGWFEDVGHPQLFRVKNRNQLHPAFRIREGNQSSAEGWVSYQSQASPTEESPWSGRLLVDLQNIAGTGRTFRMSGETGNLERSAEFMYREPFLLGTSAWADLNAGIWQQDTTSRKAWGGVDLNVPMDFEWDLVLGVGGATAREEDLGVRSRWGTIGVRRDSRDRLPLSRKGWMWSSLWSAGTRKLQRDLAPDTTVSYAKTTTALGIWLPLWKQLGWVNQAYAEGIWPRRGEYLESEQISLGGEHLSGYWPRSIRTMAYAHVLSALQWTWSKSQVQFFGEGANYIPVSGVGTDTRLSYGISLSQEMRGVALGIKLAWSEEAKVGEALLSIRVLTRF